MRKIISKEAEEKKRKRNQFVVGGIMVLVLVTSVIGYAFNREEKSDTSKVIYNGFEFIQESGFWYVNAGDFQFSFLFNPEETEKINSGLNLLSSYEEKPLYIYSENSEADIEIYRNLFYQNQIVQRMQNACIAGKKCADDVPVKTCTDNFIIIREGNSSSVTQQDNCVFIEGNSENLTRLADGFLFKIVGVQ
ncbi:hypothetical protein A3K64_01770 [Candidatus Micrarchaeota archaeon RBG_16_36_9]|nr:MAG: hypothetical protein A3K64_01770 [Candidatus Micrarchaeota archaeon RBG_16_36_9]